MCVYCMTRYVFSRMSSNFEFEFACQKVCHNIQKYVKQSKKYVMTSNSILWYRKWWRVCPDFIAYDINQKVCNDVKK